MHPVVVDIPMRIRFRGITRRQALLWEGPAGWTEWSPFLDYSGDELVPWLHAATEAADIGWPAPVRQQIPVNCTVPVIGPEQAAERVLASGCTTAKVKVADPRSSAAEDEARVAAVRDALGAGGRVRIDANGAWDLDTAVDRVTRLARFELEYAEQPVASTEDLARLRVRLARAGVDVAVAADESIRRSGDPERVKELDAADVAVLKVQPLGGVRRCLELADMLDLPVVVSSALETSVGLAAGVALAAALPELPYACGLNTANLLTGDVVAEPLAAVAGQISVPDQRPALDEVAAAGVAASAEVRQWWEQRLADTREAE